jgi:arsenite/tail-anchored protein-transporting ATPase
VGKTSVACATAIRLADQGKKTLLVSTDPASNLEEVLGCRVSNEAPQVVEGVPDLFALDVDPEAAAHRYRERVVGPYRGVLPDATVASIEEQLSGGCTLEIAAFDEFALLLSGTNDSTFDHILFDTAPTGHTLRLLELPGAWTEFLDTNTTGTSCLGPLSGLGAERSAYSQALAALRDAERTEVVLVARAEPASVREAARTSDELAALGIHAQHLVLNGVIPDTVSGDEVGQQIAHQARQTRAALPPSLSRLRRTEVPLKASAPLGIFSLRALWVEDDMRETEPTSHALTTPPAFDELANIVDELDAAGHGVVLTMGKGGVGKTRIAAMLARELAERGHSVHLTTTDRAAHVRDEMEAAPPGLRISRIDPAVEVRRYTEAVLSGADHELDADGRALLEEDLRSPCTEETAVFQAFAEVVEAGEKEIVVIDTAPTGHTILLLDAAEAYHREVLRKPGNAPDAVRNLLPRLRDPEFARVVLVTLPAATPVHEARRLQDDLARAGINPTAWVVNQCLTGLTLTDPFLLRRQAEEAPFLGEVAGLCERVAVVPWTETSRTHLSRSEELLDGAPA